MQSTLDMFYSILSTFWGLILFFFFRSQLEQHIWVQDWCGDRLYAIMVMLVHFIDLIIALLLSSGENILLGITFLIPTSHLPWKKSSISGDTMVVRGSIEGVWLWGLMILRSHLKQMSCVAIGGNGNSLSFGKWENFCYWSVPRGQLSSLEH